MKATTLLQRQHRKVKTLFKKLEKGGAGARELLDELANDLAAHMAIEQEISIRPSRRSIRSSCSKRWRSTPSRRSRSSG